MLDRLEEFRKLAQQEGISITLNETLIETLKKDHIQLNLRKLLNFVKTTKLRQTY